MGTIWRKIWRDLAVNKARTTLAVLSIVVGVFSLGLVFGLSGLLHERMVESQRAAVPAHLTFWGGPFSSDVVKALGREPGVAAVEGETIASFRWKMEGEEHWRDGDLITRADYAAQSMNLLRLLDGRWPSKQRGTSSARRALGVERLSAGYYNLPLGTKILVEFDHRERGLPIEGLVRAPVVIPPAWGGDAMFFATPETAAWLTGEGSEEKFNRLHVRLESYSQEAAEAAAKRIEDRLERIGLVIGGYEIADPDEHWVQEIVDTVSTILVVMGALSLVLSGFLIVNTTNAILAQQMWQIGVMKAVGATFARVARIYLATALLYGGLALVPAVPLALAGTHLLATWLLELINVSPGPFQIEPAAVAVQVSAGIGVPLLAALPPVVAGARITVRQAISSHGIGSDFGRGPLDRLVGRVPRLPRPLALSLRNTFRRKARVTLTLVTLTLSGAVFAMILSTHDSFESTIAVGFSFGEDLTISLDRPYRTSRLLKTARGVPSVAGVEVWSEQTATLVQASGEDHPVKLCGVPSGSQMFHPRILTGRRFLPGDSRAILLNNMLAAEEGLQAGDEMELTLDGRESRWTVIGTYLSADSGSDTFFVPLSALERESHILGRGQKLRVLSARDDLQSQQALAQALGDTLEANRIEVTGSWTAAQQLEDIRASFGILLYLLLALSGLVAIVGSIGLMSTMSINVVERRREIGVMRAIGASSPAIVCIFVVEGVLIGLLSWLLAIPLSLPGARLFSDLIGWSVLETPLVFSYSTASVFLWLLIVTLLSALASLWPALRAARISVRESLAYE